MTVKTSQPPKYCNPWPPFDRGPVCAGGWGSASLIADLLNPKVGIFYGSFLPQFIPSGVSAVPYTLLLESSAG
jgi:hypothetical protein